MRIDIFRLINDIENHDRVYVYGAGVYGHYLVKELLSCGVKLQGVLVSDISGNPREICGIKVFGFDENDAIERTDVIIIAIRGTTSSLVKNSIISCSEGIVLCIDDYCQESYQYEKIEVNKEVERLARIMYLKNKEKYTNVDEAYNDITNNRGEKNSTSLAVVVGYLSTRVVKILNALSYTIPSIYCFILNEGVIYRDRINQIESFGIECHVLNTDDILISMLLLKPFAIHLFSYASVSNQMAYIISLKSMLSTIAFEQYDIAKEMYYNNVDWITEDDLKAEEYCMKNADGLVERGYELIYFKEKTDYTFSKKCLRFLDYCSSYPVKNSFHEGRLSLCVATGIPKQSDPYYRGMMVLADLCEKNDCEFHVYPTVKDDDFYKECIDKSNSSNCFFFHDPVKYEVLADTLSQYDYGVIPYELSIDEHNNVFAYENATLTTTVLKYKYTVSNHYFDFLDAGLPIIGTIPLVFTEYLESLGVLLRWGLDEYDFEYLVRNRNRLKENVIKAKKLLNIDNHIDRLIYFYDTLQSDEVRGLEK